MLCIHGTSHGPVSVCPSQVSVLLKRLNVGSHQTTPHDSPGTLVSDAKDLSEIRPGSPPTRAPNAGGVGQNRRLEHITGYISKTVQYRRMVSIKVEQEVEQYALYRMMTLPMALSAP